MVKLMGNARSGMAPVSNLDGLRGGSVSGANQPKAGAAGAMMVTKAKSTGGGLGGGRRPGSLRGSYQPKDGMVKFTGKVMSCAGARGGERRAGSLNGVNQP